MLKSLALSCLWATLALTYYADITAAQQNCPWDNPDLERWSEVTTWPYGRLPEENDTVIIPTNKQILLDTPIPRLLSLTIDGTLVWDHVDGIRMEANYILINGEFHIGSEECNFEKEADFFLHGQSNTSELVPHFGRKFIGVANNGTLEIHGKQKKSWTKLVATVSPACPPLYDSWDTYQRKITGIWINVWNANGTLVSADAYETEGRNAERSISNLVGAIQTIPEGKIVALAVYKTIGSSSAMYNELFSAIEALGGTQIRHVGEFEPYVLIAAIGNPECGVQKLTKRQVGFDGAIEAEAKFTDGDVAFIAKSYSDIAKNKGKVRFQVTTREAAYPKLSLLHDVTSWQLGDEVVVASTDFDWRQAEVKTIVSCRECEPNQIRVDGAFKYTHFGEVTYGVDERAEVGLLSRNIRVEGELQERCYSNTEHEEYLCGLFGRDTFGGQIIIRDRSYARIEGMQLTHMGQQAVLASYPLHFHLCDEVHGQYLRNNVIRDSNSRCITIHGTDYLDVSGNVCLNHLGHGIFLEDSVEQFNTIRGNLVIGTTYGTLLFSDMNPSWCENRKICGGLSSYWITHPNNYFTDNVAAGCDVSGMVLSFADRPLGPSLQRSKDQGKFYEKRTRYMKVPEFARNVMHSNKNHGLWFDTRISSGEMDGKTFIPENGMMGMAMYSPRDPPIPTGEMVESVLSELTMYKNEERNAWVRCGNIVITNSSFADSPVSYVAAHTMDKTYCEVRDSIFIGETDNKGQPFTYVCNDKKFRDVPRSERPHHHFDRSIAHGMADYMISGIQFYQGPLFVDNCYFDRFKNWYYNDSFIDTWGYRPLRPAAAITFHPNNHYPMIPRNGVKNLKFGYCDGRHNSFRISDGNASIPHWNEFDGTGNTMIRDYDGSLTGTKNTQIVQDRPFFTGRNCLKQPDWGLSVCPYKYVMMVIRGKSGVLQKRYKGKTPILIRRDDFPNDMVIRGKSGVLQKRYKGKTPILIRRDDFPNDVYSQTGHTSHKFNLRVFKSYTVFFNATVGPTPRDIQFRPRYGLEKNEMIRIAVCLPKSTNNFTIYSTYPELNPKKKLFPRMVNSLRLLNRDRSMKAFFWDKANGYLYFKMKSPHSLTRHGQVCPGDVCLDVNINRNDGGNEPAVCDTPVKPYYYRDRYRRVRRKKCKSPESPEVGMRVSDLVWAYANSNDQQQRSAQSDRTSENQGQIQNHSAEESYASDPDNEFRQLLNAKSPKTQFLPASAVKQWEVLDSKIVLKLGELLRESTLEQTFGDIVYQTCLTSLEAKQQYTRAHPTKSRKQRELYMLRKQKKRPEGEDESSTCRRIDRSTSTVARFEDEALGPKQSRIARNKRNQKKKT
ncbi:transmembrane protein 2-like [Plakobranchus ocellatus]|uniref:Transmembrane protein 2-like n=1 Tax=Plakobranchus ocellatus TaxID=259542 RepID=A0AAV4DLS0_9GAST|nr:transmembrane protein 2-like [Plakobranchus ocellatus]